MPPPALHPVPGYERSGLLRPECAELLDKLLVRVARGRGALDVAVSEGPAAISQGDHLLRLGYSCLADYARERLDVAGQAAEGLVRLGRALADRPLLPEALRSGALTIRKAQSILAGRTDLAARPPAGGAGGRPTEGERIDPRSASDGVTSDGFR